jgi:hypothetical protein
MADFSTTSTAAVNSALDGLKRRNAGRRPVTNYFQQRLREDANLQVLESEKSLCIIHDEWDFARLYFHTFDIAELERELQAVTWPAIVVADWVSKAGPTPADTLLTSLGFHLHATYDRIVCPSPKRQRSNPQTRVATDAECELIHALLFRVFDKYADHIMTVEELGDRIAKQEVLVGRDQQGLIDGVIIFQVTGQACNFTFLYNKGGYAGLARLLGDFYGILTELNIQSGVSWVRRTRPRVVMLHQTFGWKKDSLVNYVYLR